MIRHLVHTEQIRAEQMLWSSIERRAQKYDIPLTDLPQCESKEDMLALIDLIEEQGHAPHKGNILPDDQLVRIPSLYAEPVSSTHRVQGIDGNLALSYSEPLTQVSALQVVETEPEMEPVRSDGVESAEGMKWLIAEQEDVVIESEKATAPEVHDLMEDEPDTEPVAPKEEAAKTARTVTNLYRKHVPKLFKHIARFNEHQINGMIMKGELNPSTEVSPGTTFAEYLSDTNDTVDEIFTIPDEQMTAIQEPLTDLLAEKGWVMSPTGRLVLAVVNDLVDKMSLAFKLRRQHNQMLLFLQQQTVLRNKGQPA